MKRAAFTLVLAFLGAAAAAEPPTVAAITSGLKPTPAAVRAAGQRGLSAELPQDGLASIDLVVHFASGSARLSPDATATLDNLGRALASPDLAAYRFRVEGHTDTVGGDAPNQSLSQQRAQTVIEYLEHRRGIAPARLQAAGYGKTRLAVATPDQTPEPRNRRVRIVNIGS